MNKDCAPSILRRFLEQERTPAFTGISLFTTALVWLLVVVLLVHKPGAWAEMAQLAALLVLIVLGMLVNGVLGAVAHARGEYCGGWIAGLGVAVWFLTLFMLAVLRTAWFTRL